MNRLTHLALITLTANSLLPAKPLQLSGIYPHLALYNNENECGIGAVVPWGGRLWVVTYAPHAPTGSSDKLYEITPELELIIRPESIGGTPANRMIHRESKQLFIGPYAIDQHRHVRTIPFRNLFGRPTGNARHLTDPAGKIYYASMEEGFYEVDVASLTVTRLWSDEQVNEGRHANLPGYHGKGLYSGQGRLIYANNGEHGKMAHQRPDLPSGVLASWNGSAPEWNIIRRNQFTEVTGPGGIHGNNDPANDPIWAVGWDHRSLLLNLLDKGSWHTYRLPKGSHSYDGAHGWNTEWPRIREIGEADLLMTMHGTFWRFPSTFSLGNTAGIAPRSNYLKVVGDFARWGERIVLGCDDTAKSEFLNKRKAKGHIAAPQSHSNLWFIHPDALDSFGPCIGRGAVWLNDAIKAKVPSDPYLFSGYDYRYLHLSHDAREAVTFHLEVDKTGNGTWSPLRKVVVPESGYTGLSFPPDEAGTWIRIRSSADCNASAVYSFRQRDQRPTRADAIFAGLSNAGDQKLTGGLIRSRGNNKRTLSMAALNQNGDLGYYELNAQLKLQRIDDPKLHDYTKKNTKIPTNSLLVDAASVLYIDDDGQRWRLPKGDPAMTLNGPLGASRLIREVATERDFLNAHGTFYELPARNAGGFRKIRAIATHNRQIHDYCSYRGLLIISGIRENAPHDNPHLIHSDDGKTALWAGTIDDVWKLGKPTGIGGPWKNTKVQAHQASDPYLLTGYDQKSLTLSARSPTSIHVEIDPSGTGTWQRIASHALQANQPLTLQFPAAFQAYWIRFVSDRDTIATAQLTYR